MVSECLLGIALDASVRERAWSCIAVTDGWSVCVLLAGAVVSALVVAAISYSRCALCRCRCRGVLVAVHYDGIEDCRAAAVVQPTGQLTLRLALRRSALL
eukprot:COSAG03_NODE_3721_length_1860_cov_1.362294_2_plen_100_part_00